MSKSPASPKCYLVPRSPLPVTAVDEATPSTCVWASLYLLAKCLSLHEPLPCRPAAPSHGASVPQCTVTGLITLIRPSLLSIAGSRPVLLQTSQTCSSAPRGPPDWQAEGLGDRSQLRATICWRPSEEVGTEIKAPTPNGQISSLPDLPRVIKTPSKATMK